MRMDHKLGAVRWAKGSDASAAAVVASSSGDGGVVGVSSSNSARVAKQRPSESCTAAHNRAHIPLTPIELNSTSNSVTLLNYRTFGDTLLAQQLQQPRDSKLTASNSSANVNTGKPSSGQRNLVTQPEHSLQAHHSESRVGESRRKHSTAAITVLGSARATELLPARHPAVCNIALQHSRTVSSISSEESGLGSTESDALLSGSRATSAHKTASINSTAEGSGLANSAHDYDHKRRRRKK